MNFKNPDDVDITNENKEDTNNSDKKRRFKLIKDFEELCDELSEIYLKKKTSSFSMTEMTH